MYISKNYQRCAPSSGLGRRFSSERSWFWFVWIKTSCWHRMKLDNLSEVEFEFRVKTQNYKIFFELSLMSESNVHFNSFFSSWVEFLWVLIKILFIKYRPFSSFFLVLIKVFIKIWLFLSFNQNIHIKLCSKEWSKLKKAQKT